MYKHISFIKVIVKVNSLDINLTRYVQDLYEKKQNCKTLQITIKEDFGK